MAQQIKNPPVMQETQEMWVWSLDLEDPLEKEKATHSHILAWKIPWKEDPGRLSGSWGHKESDTTQGLSRRHVSSVQFSCSVMSDSLRPHEPQHTRPPCPSSTPGAHPNPCPSSQWCHPTISSSAVPFSSSLQSFPASGSFSMSQFFTSGGQSIGVSASACLSNEHPGLIFFRIDWLDLLAVQETLKSLLQHHNSKATVLQHSVFFIVQLSHSYITTGKTIALTRWTFVGKVMSLLFNTLSRLVIAFLPKSKRLLISWLQSPSGSM